MLLGREFSSSWLKTHRPNDVNIILVSHPPTLDLRYVAIWWGGGHSTFYTFKDAHSATSISVNMSGAQLAQISPFSLCVLPSSLATAAPKKALPLARRVPRQKQGSTTRLLSVSHRSASTAQVKS